MHAGRRLPTGAARAITVAMSWPAYVDLFSAGELAERARSASLLLVGCRLCPRRCGADRWRGRTGVCGIGARARVASYGPHHGEERCLSGPGGSGTIFFSGCNLGCVFCQNWEISHGRRGGRRGRRGRGERSWPG